MKKKSDLQQLSSQLHEIFGSKDWNILWQTYKLVENWPKVAGSAVAKKSTPAYIQKKILWIYVNDSVWMQQLHAQKIQLLEKVRNFNSSLDLEDIRWLLDSSDNNSKTKKTFIPRPGKINPDEKKKFEKIASSVKNEQCWDALCRLWKAYHEKK